MPSMTWLLESTSFSRGFLLRKMVGTGKQAGTHLSQPLVKQPILSSPTTSLSSVGRGSDLQKTNPSSQVPRFLEFLPCPSTGLSHTPGYNIVMCNEELGPDGL